jgi:hypothetical protein
VLLPAVGSTGCRSSVPVQTAMMDAGEWYDALQLTDVVPDCVVLPAYELHV